MVYQKTILKSSRKNKDSTTKTQVNVDTYKTAKYWKVFTNIIGE